MPDSAASPATLQKEPERGRIARGVKGVCLLAFSCCLFSLTASAQQAQGEPVPDAPSPAQQTAATTQPVNPLQSSVSIFLELQKRSIIFPDLATTSGPLSTWGKFKLAANNSVSVPTVGSALIGAGFGQAIDSPAGYHQGMEGYGKRFGANMARSASDQFFGTFILASALHEDPRFYVKKDLNFKQSVEYAAIRVLYTRSDSGERVVNYSGLLGPLAGETLANTYYPEGNRGVGSTLIRYASDLGWRFGGHLLRQYWPTINKRLQLAPEPGPAPEPPPAKP